jgi:hypothetical protein
MQYPQEFSPEARARVEAVRLNATRECEQKRDELPRSQYDHLDRHLRSINEPHPISYLLGAEKGTRTPTSFLSPADSKLSRFAGVSEAQPSREPAGEILSVFCEGSLPKRTLAEIAIPRCARNAWELVPRGGLEPPRAF